MYRTIYVIKLKNQETSLKGTTFLFFFGKCCIFSPQGILKKCGHWVLLPSNLVIIYSHAAQIYVTILDELEIYMALLWHYMAYLILILLVNPLHGIIFKSLTRKNEHSPSRSSSWSSPREPRWSYAESLPQPHRNNGVEEKHVSLELIIAG